MTADVSPDREPTTYDVMATAPCPAFRWIGQSFTSCDGCGKPYWLHSHDARLPKGAGPFGPTRWRHVVITRERARAVERKWA